MLSPFTLCILILLLEMFFYTIFTNRTSIFSFKPLHYARFMESMQARKDQVLLIFFVVKLTNSTQLILL